jgi:CelD/BcsL family acetyltransferase involved in cellulose biosynthesis
MSWSLHAISEFDKLRDQWDSLNARGINTPLLDADFVAPLLAEFSTGREVIACRTSSGMVDVMTVLTPSKRGTWHTLQPSQAPVGLWLQQPDLEMEPLLSSLLRKLPGFPLVLGVTQQDPQLLPRPTESGIIKTVDYIETAKITFEGSFEEYWSKRGKNLRQNLKKQRSKLDNEGITLSMRVVTSPADVAEAMADYGRLESSGWKGTQGTAVHPDNAQGRFYRKMLELFCARGLGQIYRYMYGDKVAAMNLCIEGRGSMIVLKTAYDESIKDGTSPSFLLRQDELKHLFDEGRLESLEFYGKVMDWHRKWTDDSRTIYHVNCYRYPFLGQLHSAMKSASASRKAGPETINQDA